jgi:hypothetical protein
MSGDCFVYDCVCVYECEGAGMDKSSRGCSHR